MKSIMIDPDYDGGPKTVAYTGTAGSTGNFPAGAVAVLVFVTTAAYVIVGDTVTATTSNGVPLPANEPVLIKVRNKGQPWRVSAIQIASGGNLYAMPVMPAPVS